MIRCYDCLDFFTPELPRQWYCEPCRDKASQSVVIDTYYSTHKVHKLIPTPNWRLKNAIAAKFQSVNQAASRAGIPHATLEGWIKGHVPTHPLRVLPLCQVLGVTPEMVFDSEFIHQLNKAKAKTEKEYN